MKKGSCFKGDPSGGGNDHYWVIVGASDAKVFLVSFTSPNGAKNPHIARPSDFPCLQYNSIIAWARALHINLPIVRGWVNDSKMVRCSSATEHAVDKILHTPA